MTDTSQRRRVFTVEEANELLPELVPLLEQLQEACRSLLAWMQRSGYSTDDLDRLLSEQQVHPDVQSTLDQMSQCVAAIEQFGCVVNSVTQSRIDFPTMINDVPAFLCWQYGERRVTHWHAAGDESGERLPLVPESSLARSQLN